MTERRIDAETRQRIDEMLQGVQSRERRLRLAVRLVLAGMVAFFVLFVVAWFIWRDQVERDRDQDRAVVATIQAERVRNIREACFAQNRRHDQTIATLERLLRERLREATPEERAQAEQGRVGTVLLIKALAPKRDCDALVRRQTGRSSAETG